MDGRCMGKHLLSVPVFSSLFRIFAGIGIFFRGGV